MTIKTSQVLPQFFFSFFYAKEHSNIYNLDSFVSTKSKTSALVEVISVFKCTLNLFKLSYLVLLS